MKKEQFIVITKGYPSEKNIYNNAFVHSRVLEYKKKGLFIDVFSIDNEQKDLYSYKYEGVNVQSGGYEDLKEILKKYNYKKVLVHFAWKKTMKTIFESVPNKNIIVWVHGVEALGWYRRLFNIEFCFTSIIKFLGYIILNTEQMIFMRKMIKSKSNIHYIFVSEWMKTILEKDTLTIGKIKNYSIIPNVINEKIFNYTKKNPEDRFKVFNIRPYHSKKYANDILVKTILLLSKSEFFPQLEFNLYGDGRLFNKTLKPLRKFQNVKISQGFLSQSEISINHKKNGILLMPTRQDAQGVSMCEAMSSGLVPVVSNNTAIPEYVNDNCGYLCYNYKEMANAIISLINNPSIFSKKSKRSSEYIQKKCSLKIIIEEEIKIILK